MSAQLQWPPPKLQDHQNCKFWSEKPAPKTHTCSGDRLEGCCYSLLFGFCRPLLTLFLVVKSKIFFQNISVSVQQKKMFDPEQQDETYDMDDDFDCEVEKEVKTVKVKEKKKFGD